jgi:hypothetical protein
MQSYGESQSEKRRLAIQKWQQMVMNGESLLPVMGSFCGGGRTYRVVKEEKATMSLITQRKQLNRWRRDMEDPQENMTQHRLLTEKKQPSGDVLNGMFPAATIGSLFGVAKNAIVWRKPKRKTKPGNPQVVANGYEWRTSTAGFSLWMRSYLADGRRRKLIYIAYFSRDTIKMLGRIYGSK